jgi:hypothetical protein
MHPLLERMNEQTRRQFLGRSGFGLGTAALTWLLQGEGRATGQGLLPGLPHFAPKAKRVIYCSTTSRTSGRGAGPSCRRRFGKGSVSPG